MQTAILIAVQVIIGAGLLGIGYWLGRQRIATSRRDFDRMRREMAPGVSAATIRKGWPPVPGKLPPPPDSVITPEKALTDDEVSKIIEVWQERDVPEDPRLLDEWAQIESEAAMTREESGV